MKIIILLTLLLSAFGNSFDTDDDTYKIFIRSTKGMITKKKLTTGKNVSYLDISFSEVEGIEPDSFCELPNLKTLYINGNEKFPKISKQLFVCTPKLSYVTIDAYERSNQEFERDTLNNLKELTFMRLNDINIGRIGKDMLTGVDNLEFLNLVSCKISEIDADAFSSLSNLKELHLGHNLIKSFKPGTFQNLPKLSELMLNKNLISELDWKQWNPLPSLKALDFADNPLTICDISKFKEYFPNIHSCNLGNSFNESQKLAIKDESKKLNLIFRFVNYYG